MYVSTYVVMYVIHVHVLLAKTVHFLVFYCADIIREVALLVYWSGLCLPFTAIRLLYWLLCCLEFRWFLALSVCFVKSVLFVKQITGCNPH